MPTSTARYRFEFQIYEWADAWSRALTGERSAVFIGFRDDGTVRRIYVAPPEQPFDGSQKTTLAESYTRWFYFSPYDEEGTGYIEWLNLPLSVPKNWLGKSFSDADFLDMRSDGARDGWPESWRAIVS